MFSVWKVNCLQVIIVIFIITIIILLLLLFYSRWLYSQGSLKINVKIKYGLDTNPLIRLVEKQTKKPSCRRTALKCWTSSSSSSSLSSSSSSLCPPAQSLCDYASLLLLLLLPGTIISTKTAMHNSQFVLIMNKVEKITSDTSFRSRDCTKLFAEQVGREWQLQILRLCPEHKLFSSVLQRSAAL